MKYISGLTRGSHYFLCLFDVFGMAAEHCRIGAGINMEGYSMLAILGRGESCSIPLGQLFDEWLGKYETLE